MEGDLAEEDGASASDNNVFLVSALFSEVSQAIAENTVSNFTTKLVAEAVFKNGVGAVPPQRHHGKSWKSFF